MEEVVIKENKIQDQKASTSPLQWVVIGAIVGALLYGFASSGGFAFGKIELTENPSYLFSSNFDSHKAKVQGVAIGDSVLKIDPATVTEQNNAGWMHRGEDIGYRVSGGHVVEMILKNDATRRMGLLRDEEIIVRFGNPDKIEEEKEILPTKTYIYIDKGIIVRYSKDFGISVNLL